MERERLGGIEQRESSTNAERVSAEMLEMYQVPTAKPLAEKDVRRYQESTDALMRRVPSVVQKILSQQDWEQYELVGAMIHEAPLVDRDRLREQFFSSIKMGMETQDWHVQRDFIYSIPFLAIEQQQALQPHVDQFVREGLENGEWHDRLTACKAIPFVSDGVRLALAQQALHDSDLPVRLAVIELTKKLPESERTALIGEAMKDEEPDVQYEALQAISVVSQQDRTQLVELGLFQSDWTVREQVLTHVPLLPIEHRSAVVLRGLRDSHWRVCEMAAQMMKHATEQESLRIALSDRVAEGLAQEDWHHREIAAQLIELCPQRDQRALRERLHPIVQEGLQSHEPRNRGMAALMIAHLAPELRASCVDQTSTDEDRQVRKIGINTIRSISLSERPRLLERALDDPDCFLCETAAQMIPDLPPEQRGLLQQKLVSRIRRAFQDVSEPDDRRSCLRMIALVPEQDRVPLLKLAAEHAHLRTEVFQMIRYLPEGDRSDFLEQYPERIEELSAGDLITFADETPLYHETPPRFFRRSFAKTGSRTTLLGSRKRFPGFDLRQKLIVRHVGFPHYVAWKRAFEAWEFWREQGFDYVPVEPIVSVMPDVTEPTAVAIATRVLGQNMSRWLTRTEKFDDEIHAFERRITEGLEKLGVKHGHLQSHNFCLVFERTPEGTADLTRPPRVYVIDFDRATIVE